jgi:hypothetical protein
MELCDTVQARLISARSITLVQEKTCVYSLTLLWACLGTPIGLGMEEILRLGVSADTIRSYLQVTPFSETADTSGHPVPLSGDSAMLVEYALKMAQHYALPCANEQCLILALLTKGSPMIDAFFSESRITVEQLHELRAHFRRVLKRKRTV